MLSFMTLVLSCQLAGELVVGAAGLPVPGPVVGMVFLFCYLLIRGDIPGHLDRVTTGLLRSMSLLFVPAGTGVILHFRLLGEALLPLSAALIVSTVATIVVTALMMRWFDKGDADG
ncbi:MAG: CidA/LrgA family protein [Sulfitobacter sp.]|nr:CidA/LrgA family protein [Sulfitobacter sp.]